MTSAEQPDEMMAADAPPGTPVQEHVAHNAAPVWCSHGVRWDATPRGWVPADAGAHNHPGHDLPPFQDVGAIPRQPTYASREVYEATALARDLMPEE